ncbi:MAG: response regulator [Methylomicrobium sp.]|jgi:two-component system cell cycle response regulator DivK
MASVLVIEDNEDNLELIKFILEVHGYQVSHAASGQEGVSRALTLLPDFILLDIQLPDIDGEEVLRRIRKQEAGLRIPIIAVTSYAMSGDRERLLAAGCNGYIEKPIDPHTIIEQIKLVVSH